MNKLLTVLALLSVSAAATAEDTFSLGTGFDYSTGKYGNTQATDILYIPVTAKYESDKLMLKLTVPYISITSPGGVTYGVGRFGKPTGRTTTTTNSGLGDVTTSAGYNVYSGDALALDLVGNIKLGTADATKGLGTGKTDYSGQVDGYYTINMTTLFGTLGYKKYGSPVAGITLNNSPYATVGASQKLSPKTSAGIMLDVAKSPSLYAADRQEVTAYVTQKLTSSLKAQANVMKGFTSSSPDFGFGGMITGTF